MVAFLLLGLFMIAQPAQAAPGEHAPQMRMVTGGTRSGTAAYPLPTDDVVIGNDVTISSDQEVNSLSIIDDGVLQFTGCGDPDHQW